MRHHASTLSQRTADPIGKRMVPSFWVKRGRIENRKSAGERSADQAATGDSTAPKK